MPRISPQQADAARRFTWLVDVFYDKRVKLVYSAGACARTMSRLTAMQSAAYLQSEKPNR